MLRLTLRDAPRSRTLHRSAAVGKRAEKSTFRSLTSEAVSDPLHSAAGLDQLFVNTRDALVVGDLESGRIVRWNRAAERLFGYAAAEAIGRPVETLMPAALARLHRERVAHYARTGDADVLTGRTPLGVTALTQAGEEIRVELSTTPLEIPGSPMQWLLLNFRDARCERRAELLALEAAHADSARAEVETQLRRSEQLVRDSARELVVPVARAKRAAARLARMASADGEVQPTRLALLALVVEGRTDDLERSLEQMADVAAIETGAFALNPERVNLVPMVSRLVSTARSRSSLHRLNLAAPQGLTAQCDVRRIESVIRDLIERAIRRNPRGCWIDVDLRRPLAGIARIEVRDYGRPVTARERERLAVPSAADRGWFLSRHIVEQHGGALDVDFPPEGGARMAITLPTHRIPHSRAVPSGVTRYAAASSATRV